MEEVCWICRRTKKEIIEQAKKDNCYEIIEVPFDEIGNMFGDSNDYRKMVCATCDGIIRNIIGKEVKEIIRYDVLPRLTDLANEK
jgi:hypothetical protein